MNSSRALRDDPTLLDRLQRGPVSAARHFLLAVEFLAMMLGVQRSGVSVAANLLQKSGLIRYVHGKITITDRAGLEEAACECYAAMQKEYDDLIRAPHNN